jgi:CPA2 family monovalent cation:H+ antiporter-2
LSRAAKIGSRELFLLVTVALVLAAGVSAYLFGLSGALGAFIAGLMLAETSQNHAIFSEIRPLRDVFAVIFFVTLGFSLPVASLLSQFQMVAVFTGAVLFVKWLIVYGLSRFVGYHRKTAFFVALALTEMSEFGFIVANVGVTSGALSQSNYTFLVALTITTLVIATPLIGKNHMLYYAWYRFLGRFWPKLFDEKTIHMDTSAALLRDHIIICGYGRVGKYIGRAFDMAAVPYVVVDYNHTLTEDLARSGIRVVYGDPADKDVLTAANTGLAKAVIIAIPDLHSQKMIIANALTLNRRIKIICRTHHEEDQKDLKSLGVSVVVQPEFEASVSIVSTLLSEMGLSGQDISGKIIRLKIEHGLG